MYKKELDDAIKKVNELAECKTLYTKISGKDRMEWTVIGDWFCLQPIEPRLNESLGIRDPKK